MLDDKRIPDLLWEISSAYNYHYTYSDHSLKLKAFYSSLYLSLCLDFKSSTSSRYLAISKRRISISGTNRHYSASDSIDKILFPSYSSGITWFSFEFFRSILLEDNSSVWVNLSVNYSEYFLYNESTSIFYV